MSLSPLGSVQYGFKTQDSLIWLLHLGNNGLHEIRIWDKKIKILKEKIRIWVKELRMECQETIQEYEEKMEQLQYTIKDIAIAQELYQIEKELFTKYPILLKEEEETWRVKSRSTWLQEGDKNTKFFQNQDKTREWKNNIQEIMVRGSQRTKL